ncbi:MAG: hypothetical protein JW780_01990 [Clostridiales bacterium]|nr:hypothetical protein [Clostridiales bacterium]
MANRINENGIFVFDQEQGSDGKINSEKPLDRIVGIVWNRYMMLAIAFIAFGVVILVYTAVLQFSGVAQAGATTEQGVPRQYTVTAPRGDIIDCNGAVLASSAEVNSILLAETGMDELELNEMLLELSYLFDQYNATPVSGITDYFSIEPLTFLKDEEEIALWQTSRNLFGLKDVSDNAVVTHMDSYVKKDPQVFFLYLRNMFSIDGNYSSEDAFRIIKFRYQIFADNWAFKTGTPVQIATDVPDELVNILLEQNYKYRGLIASKDYRRVYSPMAKWSSHVVGYVGSISQERLAELKDIGYSINDIVGQAGIESQMERYLHGQIGKKPYNVWTDDMSEGAFYSEQMGIDPIPGADVYLTIDSKLQKVGLDAIKRYIEDAANDPKNKELGYKTASAGAFVVMNVHDGSIIAMGSYPDFDPSDFVLAMEGDLQAKEQVEYYLGVEEYKEKTEADMPLWNRSIMSQYAPGSTFKLVTALAALENGIISSTYNIRTCVSPIDIGGWEFKCLERPNGGHGPLSLRQGIATSCNIYFQKLGVETGIDNIDAMGKLLGLGELSGIDLPGENSGIRASRETKRLLREDIYDRLWMPADTAQSAIGQFDNCFTILQLARYTAAIATNQLVTPHVIREVVSEDGTILYTGATDIIPLNFAEENLKIIRDGMKDVVSSEIGTANRYLIDFVTLNNIPLACKTGTAETGFEEYRKEFSNGLIIGFAPAENPEIVIALVVEKGEWGSSTAVIMEDLLVAYFGVKDPDMGDSDITKPVIGDVD